MGEFITEIPLGALVISWVLISLKQWGQLRAMRREYDETVKEVRVLKAHLKVVARVAMRNDMGLPPKEEGD